MRNAKLLLKMDQTAAKLIQISDGLNKASIYFSHKAQE